MAMFVFVRFAGAAFIVYQLPYITEFIGLEKMDDGWETSKRRCQGVGCLGEGTRIPIAPGTELRRRVS